MTNPDATAATPPEVEQVSVVGEARRMWVTVVVVVVVAVAVAGQARADVDWARGLITAEGVGIANRQAPSPAAAREPARRLAEDAARHQLAAQIPALPHARGGTVKDQLAASTAAAERIAKAVERAYTIAATPQTDGSWNVTLALPLEAVRQALDGGARAQAAGGDRDPPVVIVEGVTVKPALGYTIGRSAGPVVWRKDVPAWAKDAPRVKAGPPPTMTGGPSTLYLVLRP